MLLQRTVFRTIEPRYSADARDAWLPRFWLFLPALIGAVVFLVAGTAHGDNAGVGPPNFAQGHILVDPRPGSDIAAFNRALGDQGASSMGRLRGMSVHMVSVPAGAEEQKAAALARNPNVRFAEVDRLIEPAALYNDPYFGSEWHLSKINAPAAWDTSIGTGVIIAILDTGVDGTHPDLTVQMVPGWNFYDNNSNTSDVNGHGTAVAGAAAAVSNNGTGVASVAGGARIMPVRIADPNAYAYWSTVAQGITWAADHGARVANLSYVGASASSTIISAAQYLRSKGGVLLVAAGNTGAIDNTAPTPDITVVSATDEADNRTSFSTYGSFVDIAAPGINILTTKAGGAYWNCWGTSLATPIAAGVAALVIAKRPDFTSSQVDSTLRSTATDLGVTGPDTYFGSGRINAAAAVQAAATTVAVDATPPTAAIASPTGGTVSGTVAVTVNASDNVGVTRIDLRVNGATVISDSTSPYSFAWNSTTVVDGTVTLTAVAYDAAGNSAVSAPLSLTVSNGTATDTTPPTVAIASPTGGTVSGTVAIAVNAGDNVGVSRVDLRVNGSTVASSNVAPYKFSWSSSVVANGTVTLTAVAFDSAGNSAASSPVSLNVSNGSVASASDTMPPTLTISNPLGGSVVSGNVSIQSTASDNSGAAGITQSLYIDGVLTTTVNGAFLSQKWNTAKVAKGTHTIKVTAKDMAGNTATAQVQVTK
jgi:thermitase